MLLLEGKGQGGGGWKFRPSLEFRRSSARALSRCLRYPRRVLGPYADQDKGEFARGILDVAGTRGVFWQYFNVHGDELYQVLGLLKAMRET